MPVSALHVRIAVRMRTDGSPAGFGPSNDGDHAPPIAIVSFLPKTPTRKLMTRVGCTNSVRFFSSAVAKHLRWKSAIGGTPISITLAENELSASAGSYSASLGSSGATDLLKMWNAHGFWSENGACGGNDSHHRMFEWKKSDGTYKLLYRCRNSSTSAWPLKWYINRPNVR